MLQLPCTHDDGLNSACQNHLYTFNPTKNVKERGFLCPASPLQCTAGGLMQHEATQHEFACWCRIMLFRSTAWQLNNMKTRGVQNCCDSSKCTSHLLLLGMCLLECVSRAYPIFLKTSSHWKDLPWPLGPQMPRIKGTLVCLSKHSFCTM